jgi:hypothetical protein
VARRGEFLDQPATTRWAVPVDNHNSFYMGFTHVNDQTQRLHPVREAEIGVGKTNPIGQTGDRPYEERQREPGDRDALTSQGAVTNRRTEHLGTTDRGVVTSRRQLTRAINALKNGEVPSVPRAIFRLPAGTDVSDLDAIGAFGRRAAQIVIATDDVDPAQREAIVMERVRRLLAGEAVN